MAQSLVYDLAVANVRRFDGRALDSRRSRGSQSFPQTLKRALFADHTKGVSDAERLDFEKSLEGSWLELWRPSFVPDLWYVDAENCDIHLFEIEDTSPLSPVKLAKLTDFWWSMDCEGWDVYCIVFDRYGLQPRQINLQRTAFLQMGADTNSPGYRAATDFLGLAPDDDLGPT